VGDQGLDEAGGVVDGGLRAVVDVEALTLLGQQLAVGPREGHGDVRMSQVDADDSTARCGRHEQ